MTPQVCRLCGQPLSTRHGVALSPVRLRLFDLIDRRPGITTAQIATALYPAQDLKSARNIFINYRREETGHVAGRGHLRAL